MYVLAHFFLITHQILILIVMFKAFCYAKAFVLRRFAFWVILCSKNFIFAILLSCRNFIKRFWLGSDHLIRSCSQLYIFVCTNRNHTLHVTYRFVFESSCSIALNTPSHQRILSRITEPKVKTSCHCYKFPCFLSFDVISVFSRSREESYLGWCSSPCRSYSTLSRCVVTCPPSASDNAIHIPTNIAPPHSEVSSSASSQQW